MVSQLEPIRALVRKIYIAEELDLLDVKWIV